MTFLDRLKAAGQLVFNGSLESNFMRALYQYTGNTTVQIPDNLKSYIDNGYNKNIFVYSVISYIAKNASEIPWVIYDKTTDEKVDNHPLYDLWAKPNPMYTFQHYVEQMIGYYEITGNAYDWTIRVNGNKAKEVYYLPSEYMQAVIGNNITDQIKKWQLTYYQDISFEPEEIKHFKMTSYQWDNASWIYGQSPIKSALNVIEKSNSTIDAQKAQAANGGAKGLLMMDGGAMNVGKASEPQFAEFQNEVNRKINNKNKRGAVIPLAKQFKYTKLGDTAKDLQLLEEHDMSRKDIAMLYNLSSILFNDDSSSTYNNVVEAKKSAYTEVIIPTLQSFMDVWTEKELQGTNLCIKPDTSKIDVLQADKEKQAKWLKEAYWISTQDKQREMGVEVDDSLPKYYIPAGLVDSEDLGAIPNEFNDFE